MNNKTNKTKVILVTGLSGAGKTTVLHTFEDMGYESIDNLPIALLPNLISMEDDAPGHPEERPIAVGIDLRTRAFRPNRVVEEVEQLRKSENVDLTVLFMDCSNENLSQRFSETRRKHPLAHDRPIQDGITNERTLLTPIKRLADVVVDTTGLTIHDSRRRIKEMYEQKDKPLLTIVTMSFGFGRGLPRSADLVFDVRFLNNPHYDESLHHLTGQSDKIGRFIEDDPNFKPFFQKTSDLVLSLLPLYRNEGKAYLTLAFGCTGGRHRSVFLAEEFGKLLEFSGYRVNIVHRDIDRA